MIPVWFIALASFVLGGGLSAVHSNSKIQQLEIHSEIADREMCRLLSEGKITHTDFSNYAEKQGFYELDWFEIQSFCDL